MHANRVRIVDEGAVAGLAALGECFGLAVASMVACIAIFLRCPAFSRVCVRVCVRVGGMVRGRVGGSDLGLGLG